MDFELRGDAFTVEDRRIGTTRVCAIINRLCVTDCVMRDAVCNCIAIATIDCDLRNAQVGFSTIGCL